MGIGYAALAATLNIYGTSDIDSASWDVHFNNVQVTSGSVSATTPTISNNTTVNFSANLANPGDFYEFKVDVVNAGTLDAKLDGIEILPVLTQEQSNYFKYTVTYLDGADIYKNDSLDSGVTKTLLIRFEYLVNTDTSLYPTNDDNLSFSVSMTYVQGHGSNKRMIYSPDGIYDIGGTFSSTEYTTFDAAQNASLQNYIFKYDLSNDTINAIYIVAKENNVEYALRGGGATFNGNTLVSPSPYYRTNKEVLSSLFENNCTENTSTGEYTCGDSSNNAGASINGRVYYGDTYEFYGIGKAGDAFISPTLN
jgi:hypothetical protein